MADRNTYAIKNINMIRTGSRDHGPVVLLHAIGADLTIWGDQIAVLRTNFDVIAFDFPGHGLSGPLNNKPTFEIFADLLIEIIENLSLAPVHLVGISLGGMVAQVAAIKRQDLFRSLSLLGTTCSFSVKVRGILRERAEFVRNEGMQVLSPVTLGRWFTKEFHNIRPDVIDRIKKILLFQNAEFHANMWEMISTLNTESELQHLSLPAMVLVGSEDTSTPVDAAQTLADALRTQILHIIPNASHLLNMEAAEATNDLLLAFLKSIK